jgi:hypothetical protein
LLADYKSTLLGQRSAYCGKEKGENERKFGVYSCKFVVNLKKTNPIFEWAN